MTTTSLYFHNLDKDEHRVPFILNEKTFEYTCEGKEGSLTFDGYYYVDDHEPPYPEEDAMKLWERPTKYGVWLPQKLNLYVQVTEKEPYKIEKLEGGVTQYYFNTVEEHGYIIEVYKRIIHESTDRISEVDDEEDGPMNICFFPTNKQTIYFRVLETF
jgi:hypothetical protein